MFCLLKCAWDTSRRAGPFQLIVKLLGVVTIDYTSAAGLTGHMQILGWHVWPCADMLMS